MKTKSLTRQNPEISAGSMADIAFLLLIFFLVTTTIDVDKGISVKLPPYETMPPAKIPERNVLTVLVNKHNQVLVRNKELTIDALQAKTIEFVTNPLKLDSYPTSAQKAVVSLKNDKGTSYKTYLTVYNELKAAYTSIWNEDALRRFSIPYVDCSKEQQQTIRNAYPFLISEAEVEL